MTCTDEVFGKRTVGAATRQRRERGKALPRAYPSAERAVDDDFSKRGLEHGEFVIVEALDEQFRHAAKVDRRVSGRLYTIWIVTIRQIVLELVRAAVKWLINAFGSAKPGCALADPYADCQRPIPPAGSADGVPDTEGQRVHGIVRARCFADGGWLAVDCVASGGRFPSAGTLTVTDAGSLWVGGGGRWRARAAPAPW